MPARAPKRLWEAVGALSLLAMLGCTFLYWTRFQAPAPSTPKSPAASFHKEKVEPVDPFDLPVRLRIPKLNVDVPISEVGLTPEGDMQAPSGAQNVGWYKFGARPGNVGSAVLAGHYGLWRNGAASVFDELHTLNQGDVLYVEDAQGATVVFTVRELQTYSQHETVRNVFDASDSKPHLNLVTCKGTWNENQQTYSDRLVVFADVTNEP